MKLTYNLQINWNHIINLESIDDKLSFFNSAIIALFDFHAALKIISTKTPAEPCRTDTIKEMIKLKDKARKKYNHSRKITDHQQEKAAYVKYELSGCKKNSRKL